MLYAIGGRYGAASADTLNAPARLPLIECDDWSSFAEQAAPRGAVWVAVETGGTPLAEYEHPRNAVYILGSEDHGVPTSVLRGCREVVSLESEEYGSYNVAVAGSIVMYDRLVKQRRAEREEGALRGYLKTAWCAFEIPGAPPWARDNHGSPVERDVERSS